MIYLTGDTHSDFKRFANKNMKKNGLNLTADDYIIICGDFGLCWSKDATFDYYCKFFAEKPYTLLWIQGNHENYDMIAEFPIEEWHGGKVRHILTDKIILLERGQVFNIESKTFFTFGGASSHDISGGILDRTDPNFRLKKKRLDREYISYRILRESWWPEELPNEIEMNEGLKNLEAVNYEIDYIITHCCNTKIQNLIDKGPGKLYQPDILTDYFDIIEEKVKYKHWYFGHYHFDADVDEKHTVLYFDFRKLY